MKRLLVGLALFAAACGGTTPSAPTAALSSSQASQVTPTPAPAAPTGSGPAVDPTPGGPSATAVVPQYTFSGPRNAQNCFRNVTEAMRWVLNVTDAGPRALRFDAVTAHDDSPGCEPTAKNLRTRVDTSGVTNYTPHSSGQTTFTYRPEMYNCGRTQVDVSIFDAAGNETLILGTVVDYGTTCEPERPLCAASPTNGTPTAGVPLTFLVANPVAGQVYTWSAPGATPATGTGTSFTTQWTSPTLSTLYAVTPSGSAGASTTPCVVNFVTETTTICAPAASNPAPQPGQPWTGTFNVVFPVPGQTYSWSATGGTPSSGTGLTFPVTFPANLTNAPVTYQVQLSSGGQSLLSNLCTVALPPPPTEAYCAPAAGNSIPQPGQPWSGAFIVVNPGTGRTYSWSVTGGTPSTGTGLTFPVSFPANLSSAPITYNVQLSDDLPRSPGERPLASTLCTVTVLPPPPPSSCGPAAGNPIPQPGQPWSGSFNVVNPQTGQTYSWSAPGGTPSSGTGLSFPVTFPANLTSSAVTYNVQLSSGGTGLPSTLCTVTLPPPPPPSSCAPAAGNPVPQPGQPWSGSFNVVNPQTGQTYSWSAPGGTPSSGTGLSFPVTFPANLTSSAVTYNVQLSSGGTGLPSTLCTVTLPPPPPPSSCAPAAGNPIPQPGQPWSGSFNVVNPQTGQTYSWSATGGTPSSGTGLNFPVSFPANLTSAPITYNVQLSSNGVPLTSSLCSVTLPPPLVLTCAGTTGSFTDLIPLTLGAQVTVPPGQQANIVVEVQDRATGILTYLPTLNFGPGTHSWTFNTACFVKVNMVCVGTGGGFLDRQDSVNACAATR